MGNQRGIFGGRTASDGFELYLAGARSDVRMFWFWCDLSIYLAGWKSLHRFLNYG